MEVDHALSLTPLLAFHEVMNSFTDLCPSLELATADLYPCFIYKTAKLIILLSFAYEDLSI